MQTSGTNPSLSNGVRKTMVGAKAPAPMKGSPKPAPVSPSRAKMATHTAVSGAHHRRGGFAKHSKA